MATSPTHAFLAGAACLLAGRKLPRGFWVLAGGLAVLPDIDYLWDARAGNPLGMLAHRGLTHSFLAAAVIAAVALAVSWRYWRRSGFFPESPFGLGKESLWKKVLTSRIFVLWLVLFAATASHGLLDLIVTGSRGVALLAPFTSHRFTSPWRLIDSAQVSAGHGYDAPRFILWVELQRVWLPISGLLLVKWSFFRGKGKSTN